MTDDTMVEWWAETLYELQRDPAQPPWKRAHPDIKAYWHELATALLPLVREAQEKAWDRGVEAGAACVYLEPYGQCWHEHDPDRQCRLRVGGTLNPYRTGDDHE